VEDGQCIGILAGGTVGWKEKEGADYVRVPDRYVTSYGGRNRISILEMRQLHQSGQINMEGPRSPGGYGEPLRDLPNPTLYDRRDICIRDAMAMDGKSGYGWAWHFWMPVRMGMSGEFLMIFVSLECLN
jgi:hypothetical protein